MFPNRSRKTKLIAAMEVALGAVASKVSAPLLEQFDGDLELFSRVAGLFKENTPLLLTGLREALVR